MERIIKHVTAKHKTQPLTVIADLIRDLLSIRENPFRAGDGGCSSAMTVKVLK